MSDPNDSAALSTIDDSSAFRSSTFLEFCAKVRNSDPSVLPAPGEPLRILSSLSEKEDIELADALLENTNVTYLELGTRLYKKSSAEAMAKYVRTSKSLQRIQWDRVTFGDDRELRQREENLCCFLHAIQESTSLNELQIRLTPIGGPSFLALENMLTHTQSLRSLNLMYSYGILEEIAIAEVSSGLKKNTTLQELTLEIFRAETNVSPLLTSLCNHPHLRNLQLHGSVGNLTGLETLLLSDNSKITELEIDRSFYGSTIIGLTSVLHALASRPTLTKLGLRRCHLGRDEFRPLRMALRNIPSLQSLDLSHNTLGSAGLAELAQALYRNTSIKVLDISENSLNDMESAQVLRDILRNNKTITTLDLSGNRFGETTGAVDCIADGLGSNSTLLKIDLSSCALRDDGVFTLAQTLGSRHTTLPELALGRNSNTSASLRVLLETMEQNSHHIMDLDLEGNPNIGNEGASLLARSLGNNALPKLTCLFLHYCDIGDDGVIALVSALEQNKTLLHLDLRDDYAFSERPFLALAESLPEIKVLQRVDLNWCPGLASAMPFLLVGLRENTSLFRFHVAGCAPCRAPPTSEEMTRCAGGWMQEMERLGYRNRFRLLIRAPEERPPPRGVWPRTLARVATLPDVIFEVLRSKPSLVPSEDTEAKEAVTDPGKRKQGDD